MSEEDKKQHHHIHIGALILVIIFAYVVFKVNLQKAVNSPQFQSNVNYIEEKLNDFWKTISGKFLNSDNFNPFKNFKVELNPLNVDQKAIEQKIQPDKINNYFGVPSDQTLDNLSSPTNK